MSLLIVPLPADSEISESALHRTIDEFLLVFNQHTTGVQGGSERNLEDVVIVPWRASDWSGRAWKDVISSGQLLLGDVENESSLTLFEQNFQVALDRLLIRRQRRSYGGTGYTEQIFIVPVLVHTTQWTQEERFTQDIKALSVVRDTIDKVCGERASLGLKSEDAVSLGLKLEAVRYVPWLYFQKSVPLEQLPEEIFRAPEGLYDGDESTVESAYPFIQVGRTVGGQIIRWDGLGCSRLFNDLLLLWTLSQLGENHPHNLFSRFDTKLQDRWVLQSNSALFDVPLAESIKRKRLHTLIESGTHLGSDTTSILPSMRDIRSRSELYIGQWLNADSGEQNAIRKATEKPPPEPIGKKFVSDVLKDNITVSLPILAHGYSLPTPKFEERSIFPKFIKEAWKGRSAPTEEEEELPEDTGISITVKQADESFSLNKPSSDNWQEYVTEKWNVLSPELQADAFAIKVYSILQETSEEKLSEQLDEMLQKIQNTINENITQLEDDLSSFSSVDERAAKIESQLTSTSTETLFDNTLERLARTLASIRYLQHRLKNLEEGEEQVEQPDARTKLLELREQWLQEEQNLLEEGKSLPSMGGVMLEVGAVVTMTTAFTLGIGFPIGCIFGLSRYNARIKELNTYFSKWERFEQKLITEANELSKVYSERVDFQVKQLRSMMLLEMRQSLVAIEKRLLVELNGFIAYVNQEYARLVKKVNFRNSYSESVGRFSYRPDEEILSKFSSIDDETKQHFYESLYSRVLKKSIKLSKIPIPATLDDHESVLRELVDSTRGFGFASPMDDAITTKIKDGLKGSLEKAWYYSQDRENFSSRNISTQDLEQFQVQYCNFAIVGDELRRNKRFEFQQILDRVIKASGTELSVASGVQQNTTSVLYTESPDSETSSKDTSSNPLSIELGFPSEIGLFASVSMLHIKVNPEQGKSLNAQSSSEDENLVEPSVTDSTGKTEVKEETEG